MAFLEHLPLSRPSFYRFPERQHRPLLQESRKLRAHGPDCRPALDPGEHRRLRWRSHQRHAAGPRNGRGMRELPGDVQRCS